MYSSLKLREIFHFFFLHQLTRISDPKLYVLKGGVNLRFFFKSPRYSKDMDLDVVAGNVTTLKKNGYKVIADGSFHRTLATFGIRSVEMSDPVIARHTETTQRFKVRLVTTSGESFPTKVEFSRRGKPLATEHEAGPIDQDLAQGYQRLPFVCEHYTLQSAIEQKIAALVGRPQTQARDVFDLALLRDQQRVEQSKAMKKIRGARLEQALSNVASLTVDDFRGQVLEYLVPDDRKGFEGAASWKRLQASVSEWLAR